MNRRFVLWLSLTVIALLMFQGFQCASPEFTGAKVHIQQRKFNEAIPLLEKEVANNPQNEEAWYLLGAIRADLGEYEAMNKAFDEALKLGPRHAQEIHGIRYNKWGQHINAGVNYLERASADSAEFFERSVEEFTNAARSYPDTALSYRYLGYAYNNKGDYPKALEAFKKAWSMGDEIESANRAARIHIFRGLEHKQKFEAENGDKIRAYKNLNQIRKGTRKSDVMAWFGAPDNIKKGPRNTKKEDWTYNKYQLLLAIDNDRVVERTFRSPYNPGIDSSAHKSALVEFASAIEMLEQALKVDPKETESVNLLLQAYVESERIKEAIGVFEAQVQDNPENSQSRYLLGVLLRQDGRHDDAVGQFKEAIRIDPDFHDAIYDIGATYYNWGVDLVRDADEKGVEPTLAVEKFEKALPYMIQVSEHRPDSPDIWETLGTIYARLGQTQKATEAFTKADKLRQGIN
jgi:tetratricopeptide (TPR) repeat protein